MSTKRFWQQIMSPFLWQNINKFLATVKHHRMLFSPVIIQRCFKWGKWTTKGILFRETRLTIVAFIISSGMLMVHWTCCGSFRASFGLVSFIYVRSAMRISSCDEWRTNINYLRMRLKVRRISIEWKKSFPWNVKKEIKFLWNFTLSISKALKYFISFTNS